jgi:hypothetical protein
MLRKLLPSCLALLFGLGAVATAQETQPPKPTEPNQSMRRQRPGRAFPRRHLRERRAKMDLDRALNLTDEQRKLGQAIRQKHIASMKTQREQMFQLRERRLAGTFSDQDRALAQSLRQEMRTAMRAMRQESLTILTQEQRSQFESLGQQRKERREQMKQRREERRQNRPPLD